MPYSAGCVSDVQLLNNVCNDGIVFTMPVHYGVIWLLLPPLPFTVSAPLLMQYLRVRSRSPLLRVPSSMSVERAIVAEIDGFEPVLEHGSSHACPANGHDHMYALKTSST